MASFLRFAVEQFLAGKSHELKEYVIGVEVFRRAPGYDTRLDPVVRVEARRLRSKLTAYYAEEGKADDLIVDLPKGSYVPTFRRRSDIAESVAADAPAIAVLPFSNIGRDADDYFSDGLAQEIIYLLTRVDGLRVLAWHSAVTMRDDPDPRAFGREFNVSAMLTGSIRRTEQRIRISAQLIDTATGFYMWSDTYDRDLADVLAIQEQIAASIVASLHRKLVPCANERGRLKSPNLDAYNLYLRGRSFWNKRTEDGLGKAIELFQQAMELDAEFAMAYSGLADSYCIMAEYSLAQPHETLSRARQAAMRALSIDPNLGEAETSLGFIRSAYDWEWTEGEQHYKRAIALNPGYASAHHWYGIDFLAMLGRLDEAGHHIRLAHALDPFSPSILEGIGYLEVLRRRYSVAMETYQALISRFPNFYKAYSATGRVFLQLGRFEEAIDMFQKARSMAGDMPSILGALGQAYAYSGNAECARGVLEQLAARSRQLYVPLTPSALVHIALGEHDKALEFLEESVRRRELSLISLKVHPAYEPIRNEQRFIRILQTMRLE